MFKAFTADWNDIPEDVNRDALGGDCVETDTMKYYDDYLVVQVDGKTIYCKAETSLSEEKRVEMIMDLMELAYYMGAVDGIKHEQGFMHGRSLEVLDADKHQDITFILDESDIESGLDATL